MLVYRYNDERMPVIVCNVFRIVELKETTMYTNGYN